MVHFSALPTEIVETILENLQPEDLARASAVNKGLHGLLYDATDKHVWRKVFLALFDDPSHALPHIAVEFPENRRPEYDLSTVCDWRGMLQQRIRARNAMRKFMDLSVAERIETLDTLVDIVLTAVPYSAEFPTSKNTTFVQTLLEAHPMPDYAEWRPATVQEHQLKAWLRSFGPQVPKVPDLSNVDLERRVARAYVYDMRNYTAQTLWGPYLDTKNISWQHVYAITQVILHNLLEHHGEEGTLYPPLGFNHVRRFSAPDYDKRAENDWAGVEGIWTRVVCFMDYRDLMHYNFTAEGNAALDPDIFMQRSFGEATRVIRVEMVLEMTSDNKENPQYPILHVKGRSFQANGSESYGRLQGTVRMTAQGVVRWHFVSNVGNTPQWGSEGVQIGGVGSASGVVGIWSGVHHQDDDPAGPFWLWKESGPETTIERKNLLF